jgi:hypothetical protein
VWITEDGRRRAYPKFTEADDVEVHDVPELVGFDDVAAVVDVLELSGVLVRRLVIRCHARHIADQAVADRLDVGHVDERSVLLLLHPLQQPPYEPAITDQCVRERLVSVSFPDGCEQYHEGMPRGRRGMRSFPLTKRKKRWPIFSLTN